MRQATYNDFPRRRSTFLSRLKQASLVLSGVAGFALSIGVAWVWIVLLWAYAL